MTLEYDVLANIFPLDKMLANFDAWREARTGAGEPAPLVEELPPPPPTLYAGDPASWYAEGSAAWYSQSAAGGVIAAFATPVVIGSATPLKVGLVPLGRIRHHKIKDQCTMASSKAPKDHVIAIIKAGLHLVPHVGGSIASLIDDYVPAATEQSIKKAIELLGEKLTLLEGRIDVEAVNKEDFAELFKSCYLVIVRSHREEKLHAAAALLANLLLRPNDPGKVSYEELDHLVRCLDALSIGAISVLGAARRIATSTPTDFQRHFRFTELRSTFPQFDASLLMSLVSELRSLNLLRVQESGGVRMPDHSEVLLELTPIGQRFVERFIEGNM